MTRSSLHCIEYRLSQEGSIVYHKLAVTRLSSLGSAQQAFIRHGCLHPTRRDTSPNRPLHNLYTLIPFSSIPLATYQPRLPMDMFGLRARGSNSL